MDQSLKNKWALVLSSSKGLGLSTAKALKAKGANVIITSSNESNLIAAKENLDLIDSGYCEYVICDFTKNDCVEKMVDKLQSWTKKLDVLVLNSGGPKPGLFKNLEIDDWNSGINGILLSFIKTLKLCLPFMEDTGGTIIAITSISATRPIHNLTLSNVIRPAVEGLMRSIAKEYASKNVNAIAIEPGRIMTDRMNNLINSTAVANKTDFETEFSKNVAQIPLGNLGDPDRFGEYVSFFATPAGRYVTGQTLVYDGGLNLA